MHRQVGEAEAEEEPRQPGLARHFAADGDGHVGLVRRGNRHCDQLQHRRVQRIVEVRHRVVRAVDGERVLDQVVGADRQEVETLEERGNREHRRRDFDHAADRHPGIERDALVAQRLLRLRDHRERLVDLADRDQHRNQDLDLAVVRRAQDRPELREEQPRLGQAEAHRPKAERRIRRDAREALEHRCLLVRAQVERADRHRLALHAFRDAAKRLELLVLRRQALAVEEQEFRPEEPDAGGTVLERLQEVAGQLDVRLQLDLHTVDRGGRLGDEPSQARALERELALLQPVFSQHRLVRVDDDDVVRAVDNEELVLADQLPRVVRGDDRRHGEAPRDDRRVRRRAADVGEERRVPVLLELDHVGRRKVVRDQNRVLLGARRRDGPGLAEEPLQDPLDDLHDVGFALAQVEVVDRVELLDQHVHLLDQRPFGVAALLGDDPLRRVRQRRVRENHPVDVEKRAELGRRVAASHCGVQPLELALHFAQCVVEPRNFGGDGIRIDRVVRDFERGVRDELRAADRDAARDTHAVERETRHRVLLRPPTRLCGS